MKNKKWLFILIPLVAAAVAAAVLFSGKRGEDSIRPYRDKPEIVECYVYFSAELDKDKRVEFLKNYVKKYYSDVAVHRLYQDFMTTLGERAAIFNEYLEAVRKNPDSPMFNYLWARLAPPNEAEGFLKKSVEKDNRYYWGHLGLAYHYTHSDPPRFDLAKEHLAKAVEIDKTRPNAYFSYLTVYSLEKNDQKADETLEILLRFFPDRDYLFLQYADLHFRDKNERMKALERKLKEIPKSAPLKQAIGELLLLENQRDKALRYLEEALLDEQYDRNLTQVLHLQVADIYGAKKDSSRVLAHLKDAVKAGFNDVSLITQNKNFDFLRDNGEFQDLIKNLELSSRLPAKKELEKPRAPENK